MATPSSLPLPQRFGQTSRMDAWGLQSAVTLQGFTASIACSTWAGYSNANYQYGTYLSPMYSPLLFGPSVRGRDVRRAECDVRRATCEVRRAECDVPSATW